MNSADDFAVPVFILWKTISWLELEFSFPAPYSALSLGSKLYRCEAFRYTNSYNKATALFKITSGQYFKNLRQHGKAPKISYGGFPHLEIHCYILVIMVGFVTLKQLCSTACCIQTFLVLHSSYTKEYIFCNIVSLWIISVADGYILFQD